MTLECQLSLPQPLMPTDVQPSECDESVRDLKRHLRAHLPKEETPRMKKSASDPNMSKSNVVTASQLAVPGGFRRHHLDGTFQFVATRPSLTRQLIDPYRMFPVLMDDDGETCSVHTFQAGQGSSTSVTVLVLVKTFLTGTILVLPQGFKISGLVSGCVVLGMIGFVEVYCMQLLVACRSRNGFGSYSVLAKSLGRYGPMCLRILLLASQYGFVCAEQIYVASNALKVLRAFWPELEQWHLLFLFQIVLVPLACIRKIKFFAFTNLIGDALVIGCVGYLLGYGFLELSTDGATDQVTLMAPPSASLLFMGTCIYVYEGINVVLPIYEAHENKAQFSVILGTVLTTLTVLFICFGIVWYCAFGDRVQDIASLNLPDGSIQADMISSCYAVACLFTTPILFFPITQELEPLVFPSQKWRSGFVRKWAKNIFRTCLMVMSAGIAAVGGTHLASFLSVIGALCCGPLAIILPAAMHVQICEPVRWTRIFDFFLIVFGVFVTIVSTTIAIIDVS